MVLNIYPKFVFVLFACIWLKGVQILVKCQPIKPRGVQILGGGINFEAGIWRRGFTTFCIAINWDTKLTLYKGG